MTKLLNDDMTVISLITSSNRKNTPFRLLSYFPWLCAWDVYYIIFCHLFCIYVLRRPGICFHYYCAVYDKCKNFDMYWLADRILLFVQYIISLSSLCKPIWRHWTYKMPVRYILWTVCLRLSIFSQLSIIQYVRLCVFSLPISLGMMERIIILYYHHQIGSMTYYAMVCAVCFLYCYDVMHKGNC